MNGYTCIHVHVHVYTYFGQTLKNKSVLLELLYMYMYAIQTDRDFFYPTHYGRPQWAYMLIRPNTKCVTSGLA